MILEILLHLRVHVVERLPVLRVGPVSGGVGVLLALLLLVGLFLGHLSTIVGFDFKSLI